ncbi:MAG: glycosyltransferase family 39 protein [Acidobacteria bacterium]|nr:glycosyltransferase family 39 protein [Acidobacteriota bacterium]MCA1612049.1 glycosyltransferase family 39 protein [Acidobacteriota bacterium]
MFSCRARRHHRSRGGVNLGAVALPAGSSKGLIWSGLLLAAGLYLAGLSATPMQPGNEAMYAYPALEMLRTGDFLVPQYEHGAFLEKPPITWWVLAASYRLFGESLWAERIPGALAALLTAAILGLWVRRRSGDAAGAITALVLLFSFKFATFARTSPADTLLTLFVTSSVILLDRCARSDTANDVGSGLAAGFALALSFGVKGPIGVILPVGAVLTGLAIDRTRPMRPLARGTPALLIFVFLLAPWHWAMTVRFGAAFWESFYWKHQVLRGSTRAFCARIRPPTYYIGILGAATFPWFSFLPEAWKSRKRAAAYGWLLFGFLFLSCLALKREVYLMPVLPALAAIVGEHLGSQGASRSSTRWIWKGAAIVAGCLFLLSLRAGPALARLAGETPALVFEAAFAAVAAAFLIAGASSDRARSAGVASLGLAVVFGAFLLLESRLGRWDPMPRWGHFVRGRCGAGCAGFRIAVTYTSLDFYSRFEWHDSKTIQDVPRVLSRGWVIADSSDETALGRLGSVRVVDRQPVLDENWARILLRPDTVTARSLSLMTFDAGGARGVIRGALPGSSFHGLRPGRRRGLGGGSR